MRSGLTLTYRQELSVCHSQCFIWLLCIPS